MSQNPEPSEVRLQRSLKALWDQQKTQIDQQKEQIELLKQIRKDLGCVVSLLALPIILGFILGFCSVINNI